MRHEAVHLDSEPDVAETQVQIAATPGDVESDLRFGPQAGAPQTPIQDRFPMALKRRVQFV